MKLQAQLFLFGLLAAAGNLLGGWLLTALPLTNRRSVRALVALGAGFMLAAVMLDVVPEVLALWPGRAVLAMTWLLAGYLLIQLVEHTIAPHFHFGEETHHEEMLQHGVALTAVSALGIHAFLDGVAIASGLLVNFQLGLVLFLAVLLHKVPEGFTVASIMVSAGREKRGAFIATLAIAIATLSGILLVSLLRPAVAITLPLSAGVTLYVAATDLMPEVNRDGGWRNSIMFFAGVVLFGGLHYLFH
ncbi:MAG: ZIP family metal transporter [Acidobacteria bacterium]|nr:ZIP family metal transporter [Acidobacteriota bacterium]